DISCDSRAPIPVPTPSMYTPANNPTEVVSTNVLPQGSIVSSIMGNGTTALDTVDILYQRPSPAVLITGYVGATSAAYSSVDITLQTKDGKISKIITVRTSGQISIQ